MPDIHSHDGYINCSFAKKDSDGQEVICQWDYTGTTRDAGLTAIKIHHESSHTIETAEIQKNNKMEEEREK